MAIFDPSENQQELSYRKQIARQLRIQYVDGISVTLKSTLRVTQGHWKRNHWVDHTRLTISRVIWRWILPWPWNVGQRSLKVTENGTIWKHGYGFLFAFNSNYGRIFSHLAIFSHFNVKEWSDLEICVWGRSRSLKMARFDRPCMTFYGFAIVTIALSSIPFSSYFTLNNTVTLKSGLEVTQDHWNWCHLTAWVRSSIRFL